MSGAFARWLAIGNPIAPSGSFYDATKNPMWNSIPISCLDSPNVKSGKIICPKLVTSDWVAERKADWGVESPLYQAKVLGKFPTESEHGLIPLSWLLAAQGRSPSNTATSPDEKRIGVDIARSGNDVTVFLLREGPDIKDIEEHKNISTMETVGKLILFVDMHKVPWENVFVDEIGNDGVTVIDKLDDSLLGIDGIEIGTGQDQIRLGLGTCCTGPGCCQGTAE